MTAKPTTVYPLAGVFSPGIPHVTTEAPSKAAAEELVATGAFTLDENHPNRQPDPELPAAVDAPAPPAEAAEAPATTEDTPSQPAPAAETKES